MEWQTCIVGQRTKTKEVWRIKKVNNSEIEIKIVTFDLVKDKVISEISKT